MFRNSKIASQLAAKIAKAAQEATDSYRSLLVEQEPQITDRFLGICQHSINGARIGGVQWTAKTFTDRGAGSQEREYGADFLCSYELQMPTFKVAKGFLAQAKRIEPSDYFSPKDFGDMQSQCEKMLSISPSSFVFLYSRQNGVQVVPALSVVAARPCNPHELTAVAVRPFFTDHFECFIGDRGLAITSADGVPGLLAEMRARAALALIGRGQEG